MKRFAIIASALFYIIFPVHIVFGQPLERIEIASSPNPVGSGARALGMGGAFIAVADDATAASWNPGGLIQLEKPEISAVGAFFQRVDQNSFGTNREASGRQEVSEARINYLSAAYPFTLFRRNMIISLNYQTLLDFTRNWQFPLRQTSDELTVNQDVRFQQDGTISAIGVAYCIQVTPVFSFGFTLNFWRDGIYKNQWKQSTNQEGSGTYLGESIRFEAQSRDKFSFKGFNLNLGILYNLTDCLTLGAVLKTPFSAEIKHESSFSSFLELPLEPSESTAFSASYMENEKMDMPISYGIGFAYRFSDLLTVSGDLYRTEWKNYILKDGVGRETSPITGRPLGESDIGATQQVRFGAEYLVFFHRYVIPLRAGVFYDPAPAQGGHENFFGFSLGTGFAYDRFVFDIAYQYRFGNNVGSSMLQDMNFSQDTADHTIYSSLIIHF